MWQMFYNCLELETLDISSFNTSNLSSASEMFCNCPKLKTIYVGDGWNEEGLLSSSPIFEKCTSIVGGAGTVYDPSPYDEETGDWEDVKYAHVDGGAENPGYFTYKEHVAPAGDVNGDGKVNVADVTALVNILLHSEGSEAYDATAADVDGSGEVDSADVPVLVKLVLDK